MCLFTADHESLLIQAMDEDSAVKIKIHIVMGANGIAALSVDFVKMLTAAQQVGSRQKKKKRKKKQTNDCTDGVSQNWTLCCSWG